MTVALDLLAIACVALGTFFCVVTLVGVVRFPDVLNRMHAAAKAGTVGAAFPLLAVVFAADDLSTAIRALATIAFVFMTGPIAAHLLARAAYLRHAETLRKGGLVDELAADGVSDPAEVQGRRSFGAGSDEAHAVDGPHGRWAK